MSRRAFLKRIAVGIGSVGVASGAYRLSDAGKRRDDTRRLLPDQQQGVPEKDPADYYVSPDGSDSNPGSKQHPFGAVEAAVEAVSPGEKIRLRGGVYHRDEPLEITDKSGTERNRIVLEGYPGEHAVFSFAGPHPGGWDYVDASGFVFSSVNYWTVRRVHVRNSQHVGILLTSNSSHNRFEDVTTINNNLSGIRVSGGPTANDFRRITSAHNYDSQNAGNNADGVAFSGVNGNRLSDSVVYENSDDGVDLWESTSVTVESCVSWNNGQGHNGDGNGFKLGGGERDSGDHRVERCVAFNNRAAGFDTNSAARRVRLYNNTGWNNRYNFAVQEPGHVLANNISFEGNLTVDREVLEETNSWDLDIRDPEFVSLDQCDSQFLHLFASSPCIDRGTRVEGIDYNGDAPDLGAYEFTPSESASRSAGNRS